MITGLGMWLPETTIQSSLADEIRNSTHTDGSDPLLDIDLGSALDATILRELVERERLDPARGTHERRVALTETNAVAAAAAVRAALADAKVQPEDVSHVLSWALVPDDIGPHAPRVAQHAGIQRAAALDVDAACASIVVQLQLATALIDAGHAKVVVLTQSHLLSRAVPSVARVRHFLGDAATAVVVSKDANVRPTAFAIESEGRDADAVLWCRADGGQQPWFSTGAPFVPGTRDRVRAQELVARTLMTGAQCVRRARELAELKRDDEIGVLATLQPRAWVPEGIARSLGLPAGRAPSTFAQYAHLGGCSVVANLLAARERGLLSRGTNVALFAQGAGFTTAAAILEWAEPA